MQVGEIYYGHLSSMDPPKDKFFVLAGIALNQDIALLAIIQSKATHEIHNSFLIIVGFHQENRLSNQAEA